MKKATLPMLMMGVLLAVGHAFPVYAESFTSDEKQVQSLTVVDTDDSANTLGTQLVASVSESTALKTIQADIAAKEKAAAEKAAKEKAAAEAAAKKAAEEKAAAEAKAQAEKEAAEEAAKQEAPASSSSSVSGEVMYMEATAYSCNEGSIGGGYVTALGQNLQTNPMAVAVDPNVIPLGTRLYVEGYGEAIASDTGGAIKGNIIDVHFSDPSQLSAWGRRTVKVTILS